MRIHVALCEATQGEAAHWFGILPPALQRFMAKRAGALPLATTT